MDDERRRQRRTCPQITHRQQTSGSPTGSRYRIPGYPRPMAAIAAPGIARPGVRRVHRTRPHARPTAGRSDRAISPATGLAEPDRGHAGRQRRGRELGRVPRSMRVAPARRARRATLRSGSNSSISDVRCDGTTTTCGNANTRRRRRTTPASSRGGSRCAAPTSTTAPNLNEPATMTDYTFRS